MEWIFLASFCTALFQFFGFRFHIGYKGSEKTCCIMNLHPFCVVSVLDGFSNKKHFKIEEVYAAYNCPIDNSLA